MTVLSKLFRHFSRPIVVLLGLLTIAGGLLFFAPNQATAQSSGTEDKCQAGPICTVLHVKLNPASAEKLNPTVVVTREGKSSHDDEFFLYNNQKDNSGFTGLTSLGVIWGTGAQDGNCQRGADNAYAAQAFFTITVRGTATGNAKHINMCVNASPSAGGSIFKTASGAQARAKTITINVNTPQEQSKMGGIEGSVTAKNSINGRDVTCNPSISLVDVTDNADNKNKKSYPLSGKTNSGSFNTGLDLKPGNYTVHINCIENGQSYPFDYPSIDVKAGQITKLSDADLGKDAADTDENSACVIKNWAFRWAACPVIIGLVGEEPANPEKNNGIIKQLEVWIIGALETSVGDTFGKANGNNNGNSDASAYYKAWNSFRVLSVSIIIIAGIIMVMSQALGLDIFDAYTIRKFLPKLLISAIFIALSWWIMAYVVQFFNNLTIWIATAISEPFSNKPFSPLGGEAIAAQFVAVIVAVALLNPMIVLTYIGTIIMALVIAALTLAIRKMLIIFLIITAPLIIAADLFDDTKKYGNGGRSAFLGLLAMGPVFSGTIALGQAMARLINDDSDPLGLLRLGFLILPLFAIPIIFMRLGGAASQLTGIMNDRSKGVFDRLKNKRGEERKEILQKMAVGNRWSDRNAVTSGLNSLTRNSTNFAKHAGFNPAAWGRRMRSASAQNAMQAAMAQMDTAAYNKIKENDDAHAAGAERSPGEALRILTQRWGDRGRAERAVAAWETTGMPFGTQTSRIVSVLGRTNTGTGFTDTLGANGEVIRTAMQNAVEAAAAASGGNIQLGDDLGGAINALTKKANNYSLAAGYGNWSRLVRQVNNANAGIGAQPSMQDYTAAGFAAAMNTDNVSIVRQKGQGAESMARNIARHMQYNETAVRNPASSDAQIAAAQQALAQGTEKLRNITGSANYGGENNVRSLAVHGSEPVQNITQNVTYNNNNRTLQTSDARQFIPDARTGLPVRNPNYMQIQNVPNPEHVPAMAEEARRISPPNRRQVDPNREGDL